MDLGGGVGEGGEGWGPNRGGGQYPMTTTCFAGWRDIVMCSWEMSLFRCLERSDGCGYVALGHT